MKKIILMLLVCCMHGVVVGQIPNIRESYFTISKINTIDMDLKLSKIESINDSISLIDSKELDKIISNLSNLYFKDNYLTDVDRENNNKEIEELFDTFIKKVQDLENITTKNKEKINEILTISKNNPKNELNANDVYLEYIKNKIEFLNNELKELRNKEIDINKLGEIYQKEKNIITKQKEIDKFKSESDAFSKSKFQLKKWFPTTNNFNKPFFEGIMYGNTNIKTHFLNSLSFVNYKQYNTIQTELLQDYMNCVRISFGSVLSIDKAKEEENIKEKNIEKLITGGGNFYLDFTLPFFTTYDEGFATYYLAGSGRASVDIKGLDNNLETTTANGMIGVSNYMGINSDNKKFNFYLSTSTNWYFGGNDFYKNIDVENRKPFLNTNFVGGITLDGKYRIALRYNLASEPSLRTEHVSFGLQILP